MQIYTEYRNKSSLDKLTLTYCYDLDYWLYLQVDDQCGGWKEEMGGALELFAKDEEGRPTEVVHRIYPKNNMLAFFKVGVDSYHQVSVVYLQLLI